MASHGYQPAQHPGTRHGPHAAYAAAPQGMLPHGAPAGTFSPGTKIQVGGHRVVIQKYLSEGGFAHVYLVKLPSPVDGKDSAVLKRVAVPDKESLRGMRTEVETMKRLKGHRPIVTYIDSHASELKNGGYEVFLLMEFCDGGGLIDFMNTRLQHRLTEPEILHIFADVAEGVACMHYLKPPLLHRDLKVENVLIVNRGASKRFKVCDFGSTAPPRPAPTTVAECRLMDEDIQKHTTLQYRAPEMVDVYRKQPLDEKSDIWALGVFLYKLCYYTTPFEDQGQLAILNASFKYPSHPIFSERLKKLVGSMLREDMQSRPNVYQVLKEACAMQGREVPIQDIYSGKPQGESHRTSTKSPTKGHQSKPGAVVGAVYSPSPEDKPNLPDIIPMRRGRPVVPPGPPRRDAPVRKVTGGDPFAALDSSNLGQKTADADEISSRFPTLDQFTLLHDKGAKFDFDASAASPTTQSMPTNQHIVERLADEAFATSQANQGKPTPSARPHSATPTAHRNQHAPSRSAERPLSKVPSAPTQTEPVQPSPACTMIRSHPDSKPVTSQAGSRYVSTGTMTSDFSSRASTPKADVQYEHNTLPRRGSSKPSVDILPIHARPPHLRRPSLTSRSSSEDNQRQTHTGHDTGSSGTNYNIRQRPASMNFESSTLAFLRDKEAGTSQKRFVQPLPQTLTLPDKTGSPIQTAISPQPKHVNDDLLPDVRDFDTIASGKQVDANRKAPLSTTPVLSAKPAHKLGSNALPCFEGGGSLQEATNAVSPNSPTTDAAPVDLPAQSGGRDAVPDHASSSHALVDMEDDDMTPEMRREIERRALEEEERRVAAAQAEYRNRVVSSGTKPSKPSLGPKSVGGPPRTASTIQSRMQSLLREDHKKPADIPRTAQGYGKYTDDANSTLSPIAAPGVPPKPVVGPKSGPVTVSSTPRNPSINDAPASTVPSHPAPPPTSTARAAGSKPPAPKKKPTHLNSLPAGGARPASPVKQGQRRQSELLVAVDLPGQPALEMTAQEKADYIADFTKRFPSVSSLETEGQRAGGRVGGPRP